MQPLGFHIFSSTVFRASHSCPKQRPTALVLAQCLGISSFALVSPCCVWVTSPTNAARSLWLWWFSVSFGWRNTSAIVWFSLGPLQQEGWLRTDVPWLQRDSFSGPVCPLDVKPLLQKGCSRSQGRSQPQPECQEHNGI